jgi:hypothetical protein
LLLKQLLWGAQLLYYQFNQHRYLQEEQKQQAAAAVAAAPVLNPFHQHRLFHTLPLQLCTGWMFHLASHQQQGLTHLAAAGVVLADRLATSC